MYHKMSSEITAAITVLDSPDTAATEIDRVLNTMIQESRPVYIGVPTDIAYAGTSDESLKIPLFRKLAPNNPNLEYRVVTELRSWMETKSKPVMILDGSKTIK